MVRTFSSRRLAVTTTSCSAGESPVSAPGTLRDPARAAAMAAAIRGLGFATLPPEFERLYKLLNGCITTPFPASSADCGRRFKSFLGVDAQPGDGPKHG